MRTLGRVMAQKTVIRSCWQGFKSIKLKGLGRVKSGCVGLSRPLASPELPDMMGNACLWNVGRTRAELQAELRASFPHETEFPRQIPLLMINASTPTLLAGLRSFGEEYDG
jgi:hypothetical protein